MGINYKLPIFVQVSGGRTSGYLAYLYKDKDVKFLFQNTGMEHAATYDFLDRLDREFRLNLIWLEYDNGEVKEVCYKTANRDKKPMKQLIKKRQAIPNREKRFCTIELKIKTARRWIRKQGILQWNNLLGYRADEPERLLTLPKRSDAGKNVKEFCYAPLAEKGITSKDIGEFWSNMHFDLNLPMMPNGKTVGGNCMGCFMHSEYQHAQLCKTNPDHFKWLIDIEKEYGHTFNDKYSYKKLKDHVDNQFDMFNEEEMYCTTSKGTCGI